MPKLKPRIQRASDAARNADRAARVDLVTAYHLASMFGWDDAIFTHLSVRVPSRPSCCFVKPFGILFEEVTASSLSVVDIRTTTRASATTGPNPAAATIHGAVYTARPDVNAVVHLHTLAGMAVSVDKRGLMPLSQLALMCVHRLAYHDYEGLALESAERERLGTDLGDKDMMILRNHGTLTVGRTIAEAFVYTYFLTRACEVQIRAPEQRHLLRAPSGSRAVIQQQAALEPLCNDIWAAWSRKLRKLEAGGAAAAG